MGTVAILGCERAMSCGLCIYKLLDPPESVVGILRAIADEFGLSSCFVSYSIGTKSKSRSVKAAKFDALQLDAPAIQILQFSKNHREEYMLLSGLSPYLSYTSSAKGRSIIFYLPSDAIDVMRRPFWCAAVPELKAQYGFATDWDRPGSFWAYATGFSDAGAMGGDLSRDTEGGRWGTLYRSNPGLLEAGFFRDVYTFNYLSTAHVNRKIEGLTVLELVSANSPGMGMISELAPDWYLWLLSPANLPDVQKRFRNAGLVEPVWHGRQRAT